MFGAFNAFFSGMAFVGLVVALWLQRQEMKESWTAQAAQVRVQTVTALLTSLPGLIVEASNRFAASGQWREGTRNPPHEKTVEELKTLLAELKGRLLASEDAKNKSGIQIAVNKGEMKRIEGLARQQPQPSAPGESHESLQRLTVLKQETPLLEQKQEQQARETGNLRHGVLCLEQLIRYKEHLQAAYDNLNSFQNWGKLTDAEQEGNGAGATVRR
jgi:hypothetical protein